MVDASAATEASGGKQHHQIWISCSLSDFKYTQIPLSVEALPELCLSRGPEQPPADFPLPNVLLLREGISLIRTSMCKNFTEQHSVFNLGYCTVDYFVLDGSAKSCHYA